MAERTDFLYISWAIDSMVSLHTFLQLVVIDFPFKANISILRVGLNIVNINQITCNEI